MSKIGKEPDEVPPPFEKPEVKPPEEKPTRTWREQNPEVSPGHEPDRSIPPVEIPPSPEKNNPGK